MPSACCGPRHLLAYGTVSCDIDSAPVRRSDFDAIVWSGLHWPCAPPQGEHDCRLQDSRAAVRPSSLRYQRPAMYRRQLGVLTQFLWRVGNRRMVERAPRRGRPPEEVGAQQLRQVERTTVHGWMGAVAAGDR